MLRILEPDAAVADEAGVGVEEGFVRRIVKIDVFRIREAELQLSIELYGPGS